MAVSVSCMQHAFVVEGMSNKERTAVLRMDLNLFLSSFELLFVLHSSRRKTFPKNLISAAARGNSTWTVVGAVFKNIPTASGRRRRRRLFNVELRTSKVHIISPHNDIAEDKQK